MCTSIYILHNIQFWIANTSVSIPLSLVSFFLRPMCFMFYLTSIYVCGLRHAMHYRTVCCVVVIVGLTDCCLKEWERGLKAIFVKKTVLWRRHVREDGNLESRLDRCGTDWELEKIQFGEFWWKKIDDCVRNDLLCVMELLLPNGLNYISYFFESVKFWC